MRLNNNKRYIIEAKIDNEYAKNYSDIDKDIFDAIVAMDPKALKDSAGGVDKMGFITKQLLLPRYRAGETDFLNDPESVTQAIEKYMSDTANLRNHPINTFKSVADFINYSNNNDADIEFHAIEVKKNAIDKIYDEYYSDIPREEFDKIIAIDPETDTNKIGTIARNLLLPKYLSGETQFLGDKRLTDACKQFYEDKNTYPVDMRDLNNYNSVAEFTKYVIDGPDSTLVTALRNNNRVDPRTHNAIKDDFRVVGSTREYDILEPKSNKANAAISGGYENGNGMHWCTGSEETSRWWRQYTEEQNGRIFCFMHKTKYRGSENRPINWQIQVSNRTNKVHEFLDGRDYQTGFPGNNKDEQFEIFLIAYPDICKAIKDKEPFNQLGCVQRAYLHNEYDNKPFILDSRMKLNDLLVGDLKNSLKAVEISIPKIPAGLFADFIALTEVKMTNVVEIGPQAFMNCSRLPRIAFPDTLKIIGSEAFSGCSSLSGAVRVPDSLEEVKTGAFDQTHCKLKIDENRTKPIKFDKSDKTWVIQHVKSIKVQ